MTDVLVTSEIVDAVEDVALVLDPLGPVELKGVADPVPRFRAATA